MADLTDPAALLRHVRHVAGLELRQLTVTYSPTNQREIASSPTPVFGFFSDDNGGGVSQEEADFLKLARARHRVGTFVRVPIPKGAAVFEQSLQGLARFFEIDLKSPETNLPALGILASPLKVSVAFP